MGPRQEELDTMEMRFVSRPSIFLGGIEIFVPGFCCLRGKKERERERDVGNVGAEVKFEVSFIKMALRVHQAHRGAIHMQIQYESSKHNQLF